MRLWVRLALGLVASGSVGFVAYRRKSLSKSGVIGAVIVGTVIFGFGGWEWGALLIAFFVLSSLLSHYRAAAKAYLAQTFAKGGPRDLWQALANGGVGALIALGFSFYPEPVALATFVGAMAAVNADTWATELGVLSRRWPRLVTTWQPVAPGTSGGISMLGTLASLAGALTIGVAAAVFVAIDGLFGGSSHTLLGTGGRLGGVFLIPSAVLGGLAGSLVDSLLGATVQAIYYSPGRDKETEKRIDPDGTPNEHLRGWRWMGNDAVNLISSVVGAAVGAVVWVGVF